MPLTVDRVVGEGTTVPYAPICDDVRNNRGFIDTRGRPDLAAEIAEARQSVALRKMLVAIASHDRLFSLGCDLGEHFEPQSGFTLRHIAGGYVQITSRAYDMVSTEQIDAFGAQVENLIHPRAINDNWHLRLEGRYVQFFRLSNDPDALSPTMWIWFFNRAQSAEAAREGRERLITALSETLIDQRVVGALG